jgi:hypothetical protein
MSQAEIVSHGREYRYRQQRPHVGNPTHHVEEKLHAELGGGVTLGLA